MQVSAYSDSSSFEDENHKRSCPLWCLLTVVGTAVVLVVAAGVGIYCCLKRKDSSSEIGVSSAVKP